MTERLITPLRALVQQFRERERALLRKADAQGTTQYAHRLAAEAEGVARCADQLDTVLAQATQQHFCSGCHHRWEGELKGAELCGDCWRKAQPAVLAQATEPQGHILRGDTRFNEAARQWLESHNIVSPKMTKSLAELLAGLLRGESVVSRSEVTTIQRQCQNCGRIHNLSDWVVQCECGGRTLRAVVSRSGPVLRRVPSEFTIGLDRYNAAKAWLNGYDAAISATPVEATSPQPCNCSVTLGTEFCPEHGEKCK